MIKNMIKTIFMILTIPIRVLVLFLVFVSLFIAAICELATNDNDALCEFGGIMAVLLMWTIEPFNRQKNLWGKK